VSLRELIGLTAIVALAFGMLTTAMKLHRATAELGQLRREVGYLPPGETDEVAAVRLASDEPLTYRFRVRVPDDDHGYRVCYSSLWPKSASAPEWFSATPVPAGESMVIVKVASDPRDEVWKITTLVRSPAFTRRMATTLPGDHVDVFQGSHDVISTGVARASVAAPADRSLRILDERWLVGEGSLLLFGDRPPDRDQIGVYAELQRADLPL